MTLMWWKSSRRSNSIASRLLPASATVPAWLEVHVLWKVLSMTVSPFSPKGIVYQCVCYICMYVCVYIYIYIVYIVLI